MGEICTGEIRGPSIDSVQWLHQVHFASGHAWSAFRKGELQMSKKRLVVLLASGIVGLSAMCFGIPESASASDEGGAAITVTMRSRKIVEYHVFIRKYNNWRRASTHRQHRSAVRKCNYFRRQGIPAYVRTVVRYRSFVERPSSDQLDAHASFLAHVRPPTMVRWPFVFLATHGVLRHALCFSASDGDRFACLSVSRLGSAPTVRQSSFC